MASARWFRAPRSMIAEIAKPSASAIKAKLPLGYHFLGEQTIKNIAKPVGAYKVLMEPRVTGLPAAASQRRQSAFGRQFPSRRS